MPSEQVILQSLDRDVVDRHHMVARYVADQLSEEERRAFEAFMTSNPEIVRDIEAVTRLKAGLSRLNATGELNSLLATKAWYRRPLFQALAASIAVVAIGLVVWLSREPFAARNLAASVAELSRESKRPLSVASTHSILRTRGTAYDAEIQLPTTPAAIRFRVLPEFETAPTVYRVAITRIEEDRSLVAIGNLSGLRSDDDGFVNFYVNSSSLRSGRYQLSVGGDVATSAATSISVFRIRLTSAASAIHRQQ